eukprot:8509408-Karenia_brevis.AAC.1
MEGADIEKVSEETSKMHIENMCDGVLKELTKEEDDRVKQEEEAKKKKENDERELLKSNPKDMIASV